MSLSLAKCHKIQGELNLIGSKSLSNRALLLAALSHSDVSLHNVLRSDDTKVMLDALVKLGLNLEIDNTKVKVKGHLQDREHKLDLYLANAGTAMRPLCAVLALLNTKGEYTLQGEQRMYERPIGPLVDALRALGAKIEYLKEENYPPLLIKGRGNLIQEINIDGSLSSQFVSALLIAGCLLEHELKINIQGELISKPYVELTCHLLRDFGIQVENHDFKYFIVPQGKINAPSSYLIEGDASAASYFLAAAAISGEIMVKGVGLNSYQGDAKFIDVLGKMGAKIEKGRDYLKVSEAHNLRGIEIDMNDMPDVAMTLVPMAVFTNEPIAIYNIGSWRVKECDRIEAMAQEMSKLGCTIKKGEDYIIVSRKSEEYNKIKESKIVPCFDTYNDHRMAMSLALIALDRDIVINNPECINKTFPQFFTLWQQCTF